MILKELLKNIKVKNNAEELLSVNANRIVFDSISVQKGDLFVCINGTNFDGHNFAREAEEKGAVCIIAERPVGRNEIIVESSRKALALLSSNFYGNPSKKLKLIGVTGTNGKTTTVNMISEILRFNGFNPGIIGTLGANFNNKHVDTGLTTPDPPQLHQLFKEMADGGVTHVVMEISAHAMALDKMEGLDFDVSVLTNITQDHLDFFPDMEAYSKAKLNLFSPKYSRAAVINIDDPYALMHKDKIVVPLFTYGIDNPCETFAIKIESTLDGNSFVCNSFDNIENIKTKLSGKFNVYNALAAITASSLMGVQIEDMIIPLKHMLPVEGRFNIINVENYKVIVDFAHTPDGLKNILEAARPLTPGRLISLFGCGGDRDRSKRSQMGKISEDLADYTFVTSDNPRFEEPLEIIQEIIKGMSSERYLVVPERDQAIIAALRGCKEGDVLVIAGKGGENYQEIMGVKYRYNDFNVIRNYVKERTLKESEKGYDK